MDLILCIGLIVLLVLYYVWTRREFYKFYIKCSGPLGYPLIGLAFKFVHKEGVLNLLSSLIKEYGNMFGFWVGPIPVLIVSDPYATQDILCSPHCVNKSYIYNIINDGIGKSLLCLEDPHWTKHTKILNPAFSHKMLLSFFPIFNTETGILLQEFHKMTDGKVRDILPCLQHLALSIATQTTMGSSVKEYPKFQDNSLITDYHMLLECLADFIVSPWLQIRIIRQLLGKEKQYVNSKNNIRAFIRKLVDQKLSEDETSSSNNSVLNLAIKHFRGGSLDKKDVEDESNTIVLGAFETSSKTVAYTLMLLAMFPECQEKAFEEIQALFPEAGDFLVSYEDTKQMVYLDLILNESMRLIAPVPLVGRETSQPVRLSSGVVIPKGMQICINIFHMHRRKDIWGEDAESFNPERFLPHNLQDKHPYAFIPFTKGKRNCIGWRYGLLFTKVALAKLIRNYKFSTSFNVENLDFIERGTMKLAHMPLLKVELRNELNSVRKHSKYIALNI